MSIIKKSQTNENKILWEEGRIIRTAKLFSKVSYTTIGNGELDMIGHEKCYIYLHLLCCIAQFCQKG